jgi:hypothetical protein
MIHIRISDHTPILIRKRLHSGVTEGKRGAESVHGHNKFSDPRGNRVL